MARIETDYIQLICDLEKAGRSDKQALSSILYRYNIPRIESLERRVLDYIFSISDNDLRFKCINQIAEANNLPIIHECYCVINSGVSKEEYITYQTKNISSSRISLNIKYELCMRIIDQSSFLQEKQRVVAGYREQLQEYPCTNSIKVISHKLRGKSRIRY